MFRESHEKRSSNIFQTNKRLPYLSRVQEIRLFEDNSHFRLKMRNKEKVENKYESVTDKPKRKSRRPKRSPYKRKNKSGTNLLNSKLKFSSQRKKVKSVPSFNTLLENPKKEQNIPTGKPRIKTKRKIKKDSLFPQITRSPGKAFVNFNDGIRTKEKKNEVAIKLRTKSEPFQASKNLSPEKTSEQIIREFQRKNSRNNLKKKKKKTKNTKVSFDDEKRILQFTPFLTECNFEISNSISKIIDEYLDYRTLLYIFSFLDHKEVRNLSFCCKSFYSLSSSNWLWRCLAYQEKEKRFVMYNSHFSYLYWKRIFFKLPMKRKSNINSLKDRKQELEKEFMLYDVSNTNLITVSDLKVVSGHFGWNLNENEIADLLINVDGYHTKGGVLLKYFEEFILGIVQILQRKNKRKYLIDNITQIESIEEIIS